MKVFLDTNVLVSALLTRGLCADIMRLVLLDHQLFISKELLSECEFVLREKLQLPQPIINSYLRLISEGSQIAESGHSLMAEHTDQMDDILLSTAHQAGVDFFITGDKELLMRGEIAEMQIVSPRGFWEHLPTQKEINT